MRRNLDMFAKYVVILLVILLILWSLSTLAWNSWVTNVYLAGQPGNTKRDVEGLLGPVGHKLPIEKIAKRYPAIRRIENADGVTMYFTNRWLFKYPFMWEAIIVYNKRGKVITSRVYPFESDTVKDE
ncbi:MAG: hypothetical protein ACYC1M_18175 [Armatimonadota bacterium]